MTRRPWFSALVACVALLSLTSPAQAATGDRRINVSSTSIVMATNQCQTSSVNSVPYGSPGSPDTIVSYWVNNSASCYARLRLRYVPPTGTVARFTSWTYLSGQRSLDVTHANVYRCNTELQVRRADGTYYALRTLTVNESPYC